MPSVTKSRSSKSPVKSSLKSAKLKKVGKAVSAKNGTNGHGTAVRLGAKTVVKGAAAKQAAVKPAKGAKRVYFFGGAKAKMEKLVGAKFGDPSNPLLVSVRSGARASMPGMMDTILNLGLNDKTAQGLAAKSGNERFAYDSYRRFVAMYGDVVLGMKPEKKED